MGDRNWFGNMAIVMFFIVQALDGACTYLGITYIRSVDIESNPLIHSLFHILGVEVTLIVTKLFASLCAIILHLHHRHTAIALLTFGYVLCAIIPWFYILQKLPS